MGIIDRLDADVVIVGAGSAGAVLAARLSEDPARSVLVLEDGPDWSPSDLPRGLRAASGTFRWDAYDVEPDFYWQDLVCARFQGDAPQRFLRGRGVGGSSTINGCYAIRPPLAEFDEWVAQGCTGWSPGEVLPYFCRLEDDRDFGNQAYHGSGGPIPVVRLAESKWGTVDHAFRDSAVSAGYDLQPDHNAPAVEGVSPFAANIVDGGRVTTNDAYLFPARGRKNLRLQACAKVDRVLLEDGRAVGVRARLGGDWFEARGSMVVLCAGAVMTPAILQRSGIGPAATLRSAGVVPLVDLPVGESMQDHAGVVLGLAVGGEARSSELGLRANCVLRWSSGADGAAACDLVCCALNVGGVEQDTVRPPGLLGVLNQTFARGQVRIRSSDPDESPAIHQNLLGDDRDLVRFRVLFRGMAEILRQPALGDVVSRVFDATGADVDLNMSDEQLDRWGRTVVCDTAHIVGTCRMGGQGDPVTVVDPQGQVLGVDGLRVVDASIFPSVTRANTHLTVIMAAERLADVISSRV